MAVIRPAVFPADTAGIAAVDTSFTTLQVYEVEASGLLIRLTVRDLDAPLRKRFPLDDLGSDAPPYDHAWVAVEGGRNVGFTATSLAAWNARLVLWHLYVDTPWRGRGVARQLLGEVEAHGRRRGARHIWLEPSSLNVPGVAAYRALGFALTGVDLSLYDATPAEGEAALFFSRPLAG